jgi:hypothetical protein
MPRCLLTVTAALALAVPVLACAQMARTLPVKSLRGDLSVGSPPDALLNDKPIRMSPGVRIRGTNNLLILSGALAGQKGKVNYIVDDFGLLSEVWILTSEEIDRLWPTNALEAATWSYDPVTQTWTKP